MKDSERVAKKPFTGISGYGAEADGMIKAGVLAGIIYWEENPELKPTLEVSKDAICFPPEVFPNRDMEKIMEVISPKLNGGTGAMFAQANSIFAFYAKHGIEELLSKLRD